MQYSNYKICLDVQAAGSGVVLNARRGDTGRKLFVTLTDGGRPYPVEEDCFAVFTARKPDGHIVFHECVRDGGLLCYEIREQLLTVPGQVDCELRLYGKDAMLLTSAGFHILVEDTVYHEGEEIESSDDFSALTVLISQNQALRDELLMLKEELEKGGASGGVTFIPSVSAEGDLSWTNNGGLDNPATVNIKGEPGPQGEQGADGYTPQKGVDYYTEEDQSEMAVAVLEQIPAVTAIDFTDFENGTFTETVDGEEVAHAVTFDDSGRPAAIDDIVITWGA